MESKKINQLATELAPDLSDLTIIGDPTTGISKKITLSQMASLFTGTVEEYANLAAFPLVGVADTIYIALDTNILYRWNTGTSAYVELSPNIVSSLVFNDANGFDGTINLVGSVATLTITTALTTGSVGFIGASGALLQDNANFFWDDTNNRLGLGTNAPTTALDVFGSGIIGRINGTSTNNAYLGFASAGTNKWSVGNVQSDHRFRIFSEANSAELVSVLQTGEVGIGIANPLTKFHIDGGATALIANLDANVSVAKSLSFRSDNSNRINLEVSGTESGSNAGADLFIRRYSDAGALIDTPLTITRSTGAITLINATIITTTQTTGNALTINVDAASGTPTGLRISAGVATIGSTAKLIQVVNSAGDNLFNVLASGAASFSSTITAKSESEFSGTSVNSRILITASGVANTVIGFNNSGATVTGVINNASYVGNLQAYPLVFTTNSTARLTIAATGASTFTGQIKTTFAGQSIAIDGGSTASVRMQLQNTSGNAGVTVESSTGGDQFSGSSAYSMAIGTYTAKDFHIGTNSVTRLTILSAGNMVYSNAPANSFAARFEGSSTTGQSFGLQVWGGTNSSDTSFRVLNASASTEYLKVRGDGYLQSASTYNNTTATGANLSISTSGFIERSTSSIRFKTQVEDLTIDTTNILSKMRPIWYRSLGLNDKKEWSWYGFIAEELAELEPRLVQWGYNESSYENVEIIDEEGNIKKETKLKEDAQLIPDGVQYERITVFLVAELQKMRKELDALKAK